MGPEDHCYRLEGTEYDCSMFLNTNIYRKQAKQTCQLRDRTLKRDGVSVGLQLLNFNMFLLLLCQLNFWCFLLLNNFFSLHLNDWFRVLFHVWVESCADMVTWCEMHFEGIQKLLQWNYSPTRLWSGEGCVLWSVKRGWGVEEVNDGLPATGSFWCELWALSPWFAFKHCHTHRDTQIHTCIKQLPACWEQSGNTRLTNTNRLVKYIKW